MGYRADQEQLSRILMMFSVVPHLLDHPYFKNDSIEVFDYLFITSQYCRIGSEERQIENLGCAWFLSLKMLMHCKSIKQSVINYCYYLEKSSNRVHVKNIKKKRNSGQRSKNY